MTVEETIIDKLTKTFTPTALNVINESHLHAGHAGSPGTGDSHWRVEISAKAFEDMTRVARQRAVMDVLKEELAGPIHALSIKADV